MKALWAGIIVAALLAALLFSLAGCSPAARLARIGAKHPRAAAEYCAVRFPVRVIDSTHTEYIAGAVQWRYDTVTVDCDSIRRNQPVSANNRTGIGQSANRLVRIACPPCPVRVDTLYRDRFRQVENTARVEALQHETADLKADLAAAKKWRPRFWWAVGAGGFLALLIAAAIYLRIARPKLIS